MSGQSESILFDLRVENLANYEKIIKDCGCPKHPDGYESTCVYPSENHKGCLRDARLREQGLTQLPRKD